MLARLSNFVRRRWKVYLPLIVAIPLLTYFGGCASTLLLFPTTAPRHAGGAKAHFIQHGGKSIEVFTARSRACGDGEPKAFVLEFCGNGTRAEDITAWLADQRWRKWPVEVWCMNYPGYGQSTGPAKLATIPDWTLTTYDALRQKAGDRPIFLEANSLGTVCALYVGSQRKTPGLILQNPPPLKRLILQRHGWWNLYLIAAPVALQIPWQLNAPDTAPLNTAPALFIMSDADEVIPHKFHRAVYDAYAGPKSAVIIRGGTHNDPTPEAYEVQIRQWIDELWQSTVGK